MHSAVKFVLITVVVVFVAGAVDIAVVMVTVDIFGVVDALILLSSVT